MTEERAKFLITSIALILGLSFYFGWVGWWGIIVAILLSMFGLFLWRVFSLRAKHKREEQHLIALSVAMLKQAETKKAKEQSNAHGA